MSYYPVPAHQHENSSAHIVISWIIAVLSGFYMLPWAIAATRHKQNTGTIALLNVFLGWSGVGWVIALVLACLSDPVRQVHPPPPPAHGWQQPAAPPPALTSGQEQFPAYQSSFQPGHPYHEVPRHPEASPYGPPPGAASPYGPPPGAASPYGPPPKQQHAFGMNSTDPFSTYPSVEQGVPTVEGPVDDRYRG